jgi:thymidine kinase
LWLYKKNYLNKERNKLFQIFTGNISSGKTKALINRAEKLKLMDKNYLVFYPSCCSNGERGIIYSRAGISENALEIIEPLDIYQYIDDNTQAICIDEVQFLCHTSEQMDDLIFLIKYLEKKDVDLYISGLDLDFKGDSFVVFEKIAPYADKITKYAAVCKLCKSENARKTMRTRGGEACSFDEDVLIERSDISVLYIPVCNKCYYKAYNKR